MFKVLLINQVWYEEDDSQIEVHEVTLTELLDNPDYEIQGQLESAGWKNLKRIKDREAQIALNKKFFLISPRTTGYPTIAPVDIDKLQGYQLTSLAQGSTLVQEVSLKSALTDDEYRRYLKAKRVVDDQKKQQAEAKRKRAEKKKAKEVAKAAKILENNGIKVDLAGKG